MSIWMLFLLLISNFAIAIEDVSLTRLRASQAAAIRVQNKLLVYNFDSNVAQYKYHPNISVNISVPARLACATELAVEATNYRGLYLPTIQSLVTFGELAQGIFGFYISSRNSTFFVELENDQDEMVQGSFSILGVKLYVQRSWTTFSISKKLFINALPSIFKESNVFISSEIDTSSPKYWHSLDIFVNSAIGGIADYLDLFRSEMLLEKVSDFDSLGLKSLNSFKRCSQIYGRAQEAFIQTSFKSAKLKLKKKLVIPLMLKSNVTND